jgi:hypothetical protein
MSELGNSRGFVFSVDGLLAVWVVIVLALSWMMLPRMVGEYKYVAFYSTLTTASDKAVIFSAVKGRSVDLNLYIVMSTQANRFFQEWEALDAQKDTLVQEIEQSTGAKVNLRIYGLDPTHPTGDECLVKITDTGDTGTCTTCPPASSPPCNCGGCDPASQYYSWAQYNMLYANSYVCTACSSGYSKAPSEAWGVGALDVVTNPTLNWSAAPDVVNLVIVVSDQLPTGGSSDNYTSDDNAVAYALVQAAKSSNVIISGIFRTPPDYVATDRWGDPNINDALELMGFVAQSTGGSVREYDVPAGSDMSPLFLQYIKLLAEDAVSGANLWPESACATYFEYDANASPGGATSELLARQICGGVK